MYATLFYYTRAIHDGSRTFKPWLSDKNDTQLFKLPYNTNARTLSLNKFHVKQPLDKHNTVHIHICTPKYCGVFSSDITPKPMAVRNPTAGFHTCEPETPSVIRGLRNGPPHPKRVEV
ncbi:hypothetical protein TNCV_3935841 [Trichonephila clavipes]|nr:hypothetical protein TNCV_3935841 [Trichonephila clavipes]